jgi:hypothetical protein
MGNLALMWLTGGYCSHLGWLSLGRLYLEWLLLARSEIAGLRTIVKIRE